MLKKNNRKGETKLPCVVVGKKTGSFNDRKTGELIEYGRLYVTYPYESVEGVMAEECRLKPATIAGVEVGDKVRLERNQYGKVIFVEAV